MEKLRIAVAGGGTGGHLFPALNLGQAMQKRWGADLLFFGTSRGLEFKVVPAHGYRLQLLPVQGFHRRFTLKNLLFPINLWRSLRLSKKVLKKFKPHLVLGTGGYVMGPVLKTAKKLNIPFVIQEQNSYPGVTTRLLAKDAEWVFLAYEEARTFLPADARTLVTGNPIYLPPVTVSKSEARARFGLQAELFTVLVLGGSQGAESVNQAVFELLKQEQMRESVQWLWQTGKRHFEKWEKEVTARGWKNVRPVPFIDEMALAYFVADLAVCRAGAMTLSELMATGCPAVLVPFPFAAADHQYKNARSVAEQGAAQVVKDDEQLTANLKRTLETLLNDRLQVQKMAERMKALHPGDSVGKILDRIAEILRKRGVKIEADL